MVFAPPPIVASFAKRPFGFTVAKDAGCALSREGEMLLGVYLGGWLLACFCSCLLALFLAWLVGWLAGWLAGWLVG